MKRNRIKFNKKDKNYRNVKIPCIKCGDMLKFLIDDGTVVEGEGIIAVNYPGAVCHDCINALLDMVADPPGLICIKNLNTVIAQEFLSNFEFMSPQHEAVKFFVSLFPESELIDEVATQRLHVDEFASSL